MSRHPILKPLVFGLCLLPLLWLGGRFALEDLGANPFETVNRFTGDWALRLLLLTLAVTPLRRLGLTWIAPLRRMLGLFAFFYLVCHLAAYIGLDLLFDWAALWKDVLKRTYITLGMAAALLMLPLAVTSHTRMIRWLGARRWQNLHRLVYPIAILGVAHYWLMVKADIRLPALHAVLLAILLLARWRPIRR